METTAHSPCVVLITGAGSGIGRAAAVLFAGAGYIPVLVGRRADPLRETASMLPDPDAALVIPADVGSPSDAARIVDRAVERFGRLDVLVNNAGLAPLLPIDRHTPELLHDCMKVNALGPAVSIARAWPIFKRQKLGCIINISTIGTIDPFPGFFGYAASKAAVNLMAKSCANEGREFNIRAFAIAPGAVETAMLRSIFPESHIPREQTMPPERIARVALDCAEGRRDDMNGQVIVVNDTAPPQD